MEQKGGTTMADCRAEVDQEIEGGHYDDSGEDRIRGQAQWLVLTDAIQKLDDTLDQIDNDLKDQGNLAQTKLGELKSKNKKSLEKNLENLRSQWTSKCREMNHLKQLSRKAGDEKHRLKTENQYLEKMVSRLQEQFAETVDSSLAEIQELTINNSELSRSVQSLETKLDLGEKKMKRLLQDNMDGLRKVANEASSSDATIKKICAISNEEIRKLERATTLENMFQVDTEDPRELTDNKEYEFSSAYKDSRIKDLQIELADSYNLIGRLKHHIHHLEEEKEELSNKGLPSEESDGDRHFVDHMIKAIFTALESTDFADVFDYTAPRKQVVGMKKISQKIRVSLGDVYKSVLCKEDELCDLRDNIDEVKLKWKNSSTRMEGIEEENEYLRRKLEQEDNRAKISADEIISLQNRIQMIENEKKSFKDQIHDLREGKEDLKIFCNNLSKENEKYIQEISRLQNERDSLLEQLQDTSKRASESAQESLNIEERHENLEKSFTKLRREFQEQNREFLAMSRENDDLRLILQEQQGEKDKYKNEFRNIDIVNKDLEDQVFQLSNENERLVSEIEKMKKSKQSIETNLRDIKHLVEKKEAAEIHFEQKIKELNRSLRETTQKHDSARAEAKSKSSEVINLSNKLSDIDVYLRQFLRQRKELFSLVSTDADEDKLCMLSNLAATNFELEEDENLTEHKSNIPNIADESFGRLLKSLRSLKSYKEENEAGKLKIMSSLRRFLHSADKEASENISFSKEDDNDSNGIDEIISDIKKVTSYCEKLENNIDSLKRTPSDAKCEHTGELNQLEEITSKTMKKLSLQEQKERTLVLKLKNKKNVETALRGKISRLRKEVKEMKVQAHSTQSTSNDPTESVLEQDVNKHSIDELAEWREFIKGIVEEFSSVKEKTEQCMANDLELSPDTDENDQENYLRKRSNDISLQIQTLLRNTKDTLTQKEVEIEEQLDRRRALEDKLVKVECQYEELNKDRQAYMDENSKLKQLKDMILRYTVAATKQLEIVLDNLSGKECVIMLQQKASITSENTDDIQCTDDLMSFVRSTLRANEQTLQASIATLEMVKAKGLCDFVPDEDLFTVDSEQREMLKILRRMNQSVDSVTKRLRNLMIGAEYIRAGSLPDISIMENRRSSVNCELSKTTDLEDCLNQKEELLKILENELELLRLEKNKLVNDIQNKDTDLENLRSDVQRLTASSQGLESELSKIKVEYELTSKLLGDKEDEVVRLNEILNQHEDGVLGGDFDREEAVSTLERKRGEIKLLRQNLEDIRNVHVVNEDRIRTLQSKIEGVTKYICDRENESDSGLTSLSRDSNIREQVCVVKELEVKASKAQLCNLEDGSVQTPPSPVLKITNSDKSSEIEDAQLKKQLKHKEKENIYLQSVVRELKVELQKVQTSLKSRDETRTVLSSHFDKGLKVTRSKTKDSASYRNQSLIKSPVSLAMKDADDSSDTITARSDGSSALFTYRYPLRLRPLSDSVGMRKPYDPHDCEICSQTSGPPNYACSDDDCDCPCSDCEASDTSLPSDSDVSRHSSSKGYQHNVNSSREARKVSLMEATQAIRAKNKKIVPERVRTSNRRSLSPKLMSSLYKSNYDSESISSSDYPGPNFRHPRKVSNPKYVKSKPEMVPPPSSYDIPSLDLNHTHGSMKSVSVRSQFSSDESQGEGKHSSSSSNRSCTSPLECRGHNCKKRRRNTFSLHVASATREKGGKLIRSSTDSTRSSLPR